MRQQRATACRRNLLAVAAAVVLVFAMLLLKYIYEQEDSDWNGAYVGSAGVQRLRLHRSGRADDTASEGDLVFVHGLRGLVKAAKARFGMEAARICTASGAPIQTLEHADGSACIAGTVRRGALRCMWDGSVLYAAAASEPCGPGAGVLQPPRWWQRGVRGGAGSNR